MQLQIGSTEYTDTQIKSISRSSGQFAGLTELSVTIELPFGTAVPVAPKLTSCVLSQDTGTPVKFFTGWYLGAVAKPTANFEKVLWTLKTAGVLFYLDKGKPIANFSSSGTLQQVITETAIEAELTKNAGQFKYLDISVGGDNPEASYVLDGKIENFINFLNNIAASYGYEIHVEELDWLDIPTLFASTGAITGLKLLPIDSTDNPAPIPSVSFDPSDPDFCNEFPFTDFSWEFENKGFTTVEVQGRLAEFAKELTEGPQTSYAKYLVFPIPTAIDDPGVTDPEINFPLPPQINEVNQVLILPDIGQLEIVEPYDPETPLEAGQFYFDRKTPRIILSNADILSLTNPNSCAILSNFIFIKVRVTDSGASSNLGTASGGALEKAYIVLADSNIGDFGVATEAATNLLNSYLNGNFKCKGKRRTTTEDWRTGQAMEITIPAYSIDKVVKVISVNTSYNGKVSVSNVFRDEIIHDIQFAEVVATKGPGVGFAGRNGLKATTGNNNQPNLPTYEHIPFDSGNTPCSMEITITGSNYTSYDVYDEGDFSLPADLTEDEGTLEFSASEANLIYTSTVESVKENSSISFYVAGSFNGPTSTINITVDGENIYSVNTDDVQGTVVVVSLADYVGEDIEVEATVNIPAQSGTCTDLYGLFCPTTKIQQLFIDANCCNIDLLAGTPPSSGFNGDGQEPKETQFFAPTIAQKNSSGELIIADSLNYRVRKITPTNIVETIGGNGNNDVEPTNGSATSQAFGEINGLWVHNDEVYITLSSWNQVGKITEAGSYEIIETLSGGGESLQGIAVDSEGIIYFADLGNNLIYKIDGGVTSAYAGISGNSGYTGDSGLATSAAIGEPFQLALDSQDNLYFTDIANAVVRRINKSNGTIWTTAGSGSSKTFGDPATDFELAYPTGVAINSDDEIFIFDSNLKYIFKIDIEGNIDKYAGIGLSGYEGDTGSPLTAKLSEGFNFGGNIWTEQESSTTSIYVCDQGNHCIRKIGCIAPEPDLDAAYCMIMSWTDSGVLAETTVTETGYGFTIAGSALTSSATGSYTTSISVPNTAQHYILRAPFFSTIDGLTGGTKNGGQLKLFIEGELKKTIDIQPTFIGTLSQGTFSNPDNFAVDLTEYLGQTIDIEFQYDNSSFDASPDGTGSIQVWPIRVCTKPQSGIPGGQLTVQASNETAFEEQTATLTNPDTNQPEFFGYRITLHGESLVSNPDQEYTINLYVNDNLVATFDKPQLELTHRLDEELAGTEITIKLEVIHSNGTGQEARGILTYL